MSAAEDLLAAVRDALDIPCPATVGDEDAYKACLTGRVYAVQAVLASPGVVEAAAILAEMAAAWPVTYRHVCRDTTGRAGRVGAMTNDPIQVVRCADRYTNCASCKARAAWLVRCGAWKTFASTCDQHLPTWKRRAEAALAAHPNG